MAARLQRTPKGGPHVRPGHGQDETPTEPRVAADHALNDRAGHGRERAARDPGALCRGGDPRDPDDDGVRGGSSSTTRATASADAASGAGQADRAGAPGALDE